jgi:prepilin-type N-terminal cleavage/methylation domain-containing protein
MRNAKGFSLLELMIVLGIVLVVSAISVPSLIKANRGYQLQSSAREIAQAFQAAKFKAIGTNSSKTVSINTATNSFVSSTGTTTALPSNVKFEALPSSMTSPAIVQIACGNTLAEQETDAKLATSLEVGATPDQFEVSFSSKGIPKVEPGVVNWLYLSNQDGERVAVILTSAGGVEVKQLRNGVWQ